MALNDFLKKINIKSIDSKGLYLKDSSNLFNKKELNRADIKKLDYENITIVIKFYFRNKQIKRAIHYSNITGLEAVKKSIVKRYELKDELEVTGLIKKDDFQSLNELWSNYLDFKSESLSKENIYSSTKSYDKWIRPKIGSLNIIKVTTSDIQSIVNNMIQQGLKPRTADTIKQILRPLYNYSIDLGISEKNPAVKVNIPAYDNTVDFELNDIQRKKLYQEILNYDIKVYQGIMLFIYFGRRLNEVLTLQWKSINIDKKTYVVEDVYSKIKRRQEYPLLEPLENFLKEANIRRSGYIFTGKNNKHISASTFRRHWKKVLKNAEIDHMRIHDTRHLLGNTMVNRGESLENIGKVLGHSSIAVTKRYSKTTLNTADRLLNDYLKE